MSDTKMQMYRVCWEIDVPARSHKEAAQGAYEIMRDPDSRTTFFTVAGQDGEPRSVDLDEDDCEHSDLYEGEVTVVLDPDDAFGVEPLADAIERRKL